MAQDGDAPPQPKRSETREKAPFSGADILSLSAVTARALGGWQTEAALLGLKAAAPKLLEATLPALLICIPPVKPADSDAYLERATEWFNNAGEGMQLARRKARNFDKFTAEEEARLDVLTREAIFALATQKGGVEKLDKADYLELDRCNKAILDRGSWSKQIDGESMKETREKLNLAYLEIVTLTAKSGFFKTEEQPKGLDKEDLEPGGGYDTLVDFLRTVHGHDGTVKPEFKDAVLAKGDDGKIGIVTDAALAKKLHDEKRALTVEEVMLYLILGKTDYLKQDHDGQTRLLNELATNAQNIPRASEGGSPDPDKLLKPRVKKQEEGGLWKFLGEAAESYGWWVLGGLATAEVIGTILGGKFPITRALGKGLFYTTPKAIIDKIRGKDPKPDPIDSDIASRLGGDRMFRPKTRECFKTQVEDVIKGLDVAADHGVAADKLKEFLNKFAAEQGLDPRLKKEPPKLKVEVEFTTGDVTKSAGMEKANIDFSSDGGVTTMKITLPANATPKEIAHDCYASLYELGRNGKGRSKKLTPAERGAISFDFTDLGVKTERSESGDRVADALPDRGRATAPEPVTIVFSGDGVTIGEHEYSIKEISKALGEEFNDRVDKLKRDGKNVGDADYDLAAKDLAEHDEILRNLDHPTDANIRRSARKAALDKAKERYTSDDGKRARAIAEDPRRGGDKGKGRAMTLLLFAEKYATPAAAIAIGLWGSSGSASAADSSVKPAELVPIIPIKKKKE